MDNMDPDVVDAFIQASYEDYNAQVGSEFGAGGVYGIFSDEPQTARYATPWSDILPALYQKEYGQPLLPELYKVFEDCPGCEQLRCRLYGLMARCFTENYAGRLNRWCEGHGLKFMGHTCLEDDFAGQLRCALATMPFYEHMGVPGIDWLSRVPLNNMTILQLTACLLYTSASAGSPIDIAGGNACAGNGGIRGYAAAPAGERPDGPDSEPFSPGGSRGLCRGHAPVSYTHLCRARPCARRRAWSPAHSAAARRNRPPDRCVP